MAIINAADEMLKMNQAGLPDFSSFNIFRLVFDLMTRNPLLFIFFAGLLGGFFSAIMRFQTSKSLPGDAAYLKWYVLTKPFVGAPGATVLFIIADSGLMTSEIVNNQDDKMPICNSTLIEFCKGIFLSITRYLGLSNLALLAVICTEHQ